MELLELTILLLIAVLISSVLEGMVPRVSLPLIQIAIGILIVVIRPALYGVQINPELFLVLFIAPLLFDETRKVDKLALWRNKISIISLAVGLVLISVLVCGFVLNWFEPSIPLAAAFALGAALGPTDAVAVAALGKDVKLSTRQKALLSGEALINDASGVVSFQFAIAAAVTGAFSAADAGITFLILFFGGVALGIVLGLAVKFLKRLLRSQGLESTTAHVVLEVLIPFIVYILAEAVGVSGILAVVAAGLAINTSLANTSPAAARMSIVSNSVWDVLVFIINGLVFVMLGMQLPLAFTHTWEDVSSSNFQLVLLVLIITAAITLVRFVWMMVLELTVKPSQESTAVQTASIPTAAIHVDAAETEELDPLMDPVERERILAERQAAVQQQILQAKKQAVGASVEERTFAQKAASALTTTLAGPKGAVTLSIIFTIPNTVASGSTFPGKELLIFLASGVILCTLLMANFLLPLLASDEVEPEHDLRFREVEAEILRKVITELRDARTPDNAKAVVVVVRRYRERLRRLRSSNASPDIIRMLRKEVILQMQEAVHAAIAENRVSQEAGQHYADQLKKMMRMANRKISVSRATRAPWQNPVYASLPRLIQNLLGSKASGKDKIEDADGTRYLVLETERAAIAYLEQRAQTSDKEISLAATYLLAEHKNSYEAFSDRAKFKSTAKLFGTDNGPSLGIERAMKVQAAGESTKVKEVAAEAFRIELQEIQRMREKGLISRAFARELREEVYLLQMDQADVI